MAVKFHVFANEQFVQTVEANNKTKALHQYMLSLARTSTPHYGFRRGGDYMPHLDGWFTMHSLSPISDECIPPNVRMLHLLLSL